LGDSKQKMDGKKHIERTQLLEEEARKYYKAVSADSHLKTIYFDENSGEHAFPPKVKEEVYSWLDSYLKSKE